MSKKNSNKAMLAWSAQWDLDFQSGYRDGYRGVIDYSFQNNQAYKKGHDVGQGRLAHEKYKEKSLTA